MSNQETLKIMAPVFSELAALDAGSYFVGIKKSWWNKESKERGGWLHVEHDSNAETSIMWTTGKNSHDPTTRFGCAQSVSVNRDGRLIAYFESALSMWIKWGYGRGGDSELNMAIGFAAWAHEKLCKNQSHQK